MDYVGVDSIKQSYAQTLIDNDYAEKGLRIYNKKFEEPIFEGLAFHPEGEPSKDLVNDAITDISMDIMGLNKEFIHIGQQYSYLVDIMTSRLKAVDEKISAEEDRIRDINVICGNYSQFDSIINYTPKSVNGNFSYDGTTFLGSLSDSATAELTVLDVTGNGIEGSDHVKNPKTIFSARENLVDGDVMTGWEYARYTSAERQKDMPMLINQDNEDARCTISFYSAVPFGSIKIQTDDDIVIEDALTSLDGGITYVSNMGREVYLNSKERRYDDPSYAYESGIISFPKTQFLKLRMRSSGTTGEEVLDKNGKIREGIARHRISIDNVTADANSYSTGTITIDNIVSSPVSSIAVFANEYVPSHLVSGTYFEYILTVNGIDYQVVPINSNRSGTKMIRFSDYSVGDNYVAHIRETIKSAKLKIVIHTTTGGSTPYLSNLKVCLGKVVITE